MESLAVGGVRHIGLNGKTVAPGGANGARNHVKELQLVDVARAQTRAAEPERGAGRVQFDGFDNHRFGVYLRAAIRLLMAVDVAREFKIRRRERAFSAQRLRGG